MIETIELEEKLDRLGAWIGKKLSPEFKPVYIDELTRLDEGPLDLAFESFKREKFFPSLSDVKTAYYRFSKNDKEVVTQDCDWCDGGTLGIIDEKYRFPYEYLARCGRCRPEHPRFKNLLTIDPENPRGYLLHERHRENYERCREMRGRGEDPHEIFGQRKTAALVRGLHLNLD